MLAAKACSREEDSQEIDGPNQLIQETAESGDLRKPHFVLLEFLPNLS